MATETRHSDDPGLPEAGGAMGFDREISRRKVLWAGLGILGTTVVSMVLMWWLSSALLNLSKSRDLPLTGVQDLRRQQLEQENRIRAQSEPRIYPHLAYPEDAAYPGGLVFDHEPYPPDPDVPAVPVVQVAPWIDMEAFLREQARIQETFGWDRPHPEDPSRGKVHLPLDAARDRLLSRSLPVQPPRQPEPGPTLGGVTGAVEAPGAGETGAAADAAADDGTDVDDVTDVIDPGAQAGAGAGG